MKVRAQGARCVSHEDAAAVPPFPERGVHERFGVASAGIRLELREQLFAADDVRACSYGVAGTGHRSREVTATQGQSRLVPDEALDAVRIVGFETGQARRHPALSDGRIEVNQGLGHVVASSGGSACSVACSVSMDESPVKAWRPASISNSTQPSAKMSAR